MKITNNLISQKPPSPVEKVNETQPIKNNTNESMTNETRENSINKAELDKKVNGVNKFLETTHTNLKFQYHEKLDEYYVTLIDSETMEVIREIPPKKFLDMFASMMESIGLLVDQKI